MGAQGEGPGMASQARESGRELDARVAVEVMGWQITHRGHRVMPGADYGWKPIAARGRAESPEVGGFISKAHAMNWVAAVCPRYSTDIAAAMPAAEATIRRTGWRFQCGYSAGITGEPRWWAFFGDPGEASGAHDDSLPTAICLAALRAVALTSDSESPENAAHPSAPQPAEP